ncbi:MAG TPA: hypothetical protein VEI73_17095 [Candidatus Acidoferrum sp.]|nr:hypothetical protein [Candidatus Acidoferrum sp.]
MTREQTRRAAAIRKPSIRRSARKKKKVSGTPALVEMVAFEPRGLGSRTGGQAGDLQGVSGLEGAASESVEELLEEGNAFEANIVKGVEDAENADEIEVESHEVLEDDVPEEYLEER